MQELEIEQNSELGVDDPLSRSKRETDNDKNVISEEQFIVPITKNVKFINCSTPEIICKVLSCLVGPFEGNLQVASLQIKLVLDTDVLNSKLLFYSFFFTADAVYL